MLVTHPAAPRSSQRGDAKREGDPPLLCSVVITSYNKDRFIGAAVDSALAQTWPAVEVIVVDDASTDRSVDVLRSYGDRITLLTKPNGGQGSAMNAGFARSRGDIVVFLDCDDLLDHDIVARAAAAWRSTTSKAHWRLRKIGEDGVPIRDALLPPYRALHDGDVGPVFRRFGFYPSPPTSGNAFSRQFLAAVLPIDQAVFPSWVDTPLIGLAPLFGTVERIDGVGGSWRQGTTNQSRGGLGNVAKRLRCDDAFIAMAREQARDTLPRGFGAHWPEHLKEALVQAKFDPARGPGTPSLDAIARRYVWSVLRWPGYTARQRILFGGWGIAMRVLPGRWLRRVPGIAGSNIVLG